MVFGAGSDKKSESEPGSPHTLVRKARWSLSMSFGAGSNKKSEPEQGSRTPRRKARRSVSVGFGVGSNKKSEPEQGSTSPGGKASRSMSMIFGAGNTAAEPLVQKYDWSAPKPTARHNNRSALMGLFATNSVPPPTEALRNHHGDSSSSSLDSSNSSLDQDFACSDVDHDTANDSKHDSENEGWLSYAMSIVLKPLEQLYDDCNEAEKATDEDEEPDDRDYDEDLPAVYHDNALYALPTGMIGIVLIGILFSFSP